MSKPTIKVSNCQCQQPCIIFRKCAKVCHVTDYSCNSVIAVNVQKFNDRMELKNPDKGIYAVKGDMRPSCYILG